MDVNKFDIKTVDTDNPEFKNALNLVQFTAQSVFLTGKAGTGKSTFLRYICQTTKKKYVVLAPTGIAAINAGGSTMHSFFKLPFHPLVPDDSRYQGRRIREFLKYNKEHCKLLKQVELIIIDEISMVRADIIDFIDRILRTYSGNTRMPFGGKQMLLVGDIYQLEPVVTRDEKEILSQFYETPYFFSARVFREIQLVSIELTKVYRQTDKVFVGVLDHIRTNTATKADLQLLNTCVRNDEDDVRRENAEDDNLRITLATRRDVVDSINQTNLDAIEGDALVFEGEIQGEFPENMLPTPKELEIKVGAQIIFIKNDPDKRWVNGTLGMVEGIDEEGKFLYIVTDDGHHYDVERAQWANVRYRYNEEEKKIEEEELGVFVQFPVRLAWAITIHKSQGLTFNKARIDFTGGVFAGGQAYVALSRCRSLEGLELKQQIQMHDVFVNPNVVQFASQFNNQQMVDIALKRASADIEYHDAVEAFDNGDFDKCLKHFFKAIHARYDIEKPWAWRFIRKKLGVITLLRQQIDSLKAEIADKDNELKEMQMQLNALAEEYLALGNDSLSLDMNAALSNYDKALSLNPRYIDAYVAKSRALLKGGKYRDAISTTNRGLDISPLNFKLLYTRGKTYFYMMNYEEACADLDRCTSLKEDNISAHKLFGDILSAMGKEDEAALQWAIAERLKEQKSKSK